MSIKEQPLLRVGVVDGRCLLELTKVGQYIEVYVRNQVWQSGSIGNATAHYDRILIDPEISSAGISMAIRACQDDKAVSFKLYGPKHLVEGRLTKRKEFYWLVLTAHESVNHDTEPFYFLLNNRDMMQLKKIFPK